MYGKSDKELLSEDDDLLIGPPTHARWSYACSKLMDEFMALAWWRERSVPVIVARLFNTVGPCQTGRYGMVLPRLIEAAKKNEPLRVFGDGQQSRCFCDVLEVVECLSRLQQAPRAVGEIVNVGGTEEMTILRLAELVKDVLASTSEIKLVPCADAYAPGFADLRRRKPDLSKLTNLTGFRPTTNLAESIHRAAALNVPPTTHLSSALEVK